MEKVKNNIIFKLLSKNKFWFKLVSILFLSSFIGGFLTYLYPEVNIFSSFIKESLKELAAISQRALQLNDFGRIWLIFTNNVVVVCLIIVGGLILGLVPLLAIANNGLMLGYVIASVVFSGLSTTNIVILLLTLVPHAVIELFGVLFAASFGLRLGLNYLKPNLKGNRVKTFLDDLKISGKVLLLTVLILLVAAIIEVLDIKIAEIFIR